MPAEQPRNVLLIVVDQVIASTLSAYGGTCRTPNLKRLAETGTTFDNCYTPLAICSPARASIFTGLLPHRHGMLYNTSHAAHARPELENPAQMITAYLRGSPQVCGYQGKWHIGCRRGPREYGFTGTKFPGYGLPTDFVADYDEFLRERGHPGLRAVTASRLLAAPGVPAELKLPFNDNLADKSHGACIYSGVLDLPTPLTPAAFVAERSLEFLQAHRDRPFFLTTSFWGPHHPALPSAEFAGTHDPAELAPWANYRDDLADKPLIQQRYARRLHRHLNAGGWERWSRVIAAHFDHMAMIDFQIGRLLDRLDELALSENTVVLFTSDHGDTLGCHGGLWDKGPFMYEEVYRVPLICRAPGAAAGQRSRALTSNLDLFATVLDYCGAAVPADSDSRSLRPLLEGTAGEWRDCLVGEFYGFDVRGSYFQRLLRMKQGKYVYAPSDRDEFYALDQDPAELRNLIDDPQWAATIRRYQRRLCQAMTASNDPFVTFAPQLMGLEE